MIGRRRRRAELVLGGLLVAMAAGQLSAPRRFADIIDAYHVLPTGTVAVTATMLIAAEATAGLGVLIGRHRRGAPGSPWAWPSPGH